MIRHNMEFLFSIKMNGLDMAQLELYHMKT